MAGRWHCGRRGVRGVDPGEVSRAITAKLDEGIIGERCELLVHLEQL